MLTREDRINGLISLDEKINKELLSFQESINEISKHVSDAETYNQYRSRISFIQTLFDRVSDILHGISLTDSDTNFFEALQAKNRISDNYIRFNRMQNQVEQAFNKEKQSDTDFMQRMIRPASQNDEELPDEEEKHPSKEEVPEDSSLEEELMAEEEERIKKAAKRKATLVKRKETADAEQKRFAENERRYQESIQQRENERRRQETDAMYRNQDNQRQEEYERRQTETDTKYHDVSYGGNNPTNDYNSSQSSYSSPDEQNSRFEDYPDKRPEKPVSAADLRDQLYREEEKRAAEDERARARRQETHDKFIAYQEEHRPTDVPPANNTYQGNTPSYKAPDDFSSNPRPEKPVTAADLRDQQYREEEKRAAEREQARVRRQETHDKFVAYQEEHRPTDVPPANNKHQGNTPSYKAPESFSSSPRPEKPVTAADLRDQQYREEEKRAAEREQVQSRRQETHDKFVSYQINSQPTSPGSGEPVRGSAPYQNQQPVNDNINNPPRQPAYAFTPTGVADVTPAFPQQKTYPLNGSFQGFPVQNHIKTVDPERREPVSTQVHHSSAYKMEQKKTEFTHFGYTPTGVFATMSVNGVLSQNHTTYKSNSPVSDVKKPNGVHFERESVFNKNNPGVPGSSNPSGTIRTTPQNSRIKTSSNKGSETSRPSPVPRKNNNEEPSNREPRRPYVPVDGSTKQTRTANNKNNNTNNNNQHKNNNNNNNNNTAWGSTMQSSRGKSGKVKKADVNDAGPGLAGNKKHLRTKAIAKAYGKAVGVRIVRYPAGALSMGARKIYRMLQDGEDNSLRGFENVRYYGMTAVSATKVLPNKITANRLIKKAFGEKIKLKNADNQLNLLRQKHEAVLKKKFGDLSSLSGKALKKEIKSLKAQGQSMKAEIKAMQSKGSALTRAERKKLKELMDKHKVLSKKLRKLYGLQDAQKAFNKDIAKKQKLVKKAKKLKGKNTLAIKGGLAALKGMLTSKMLNSDENGIEGIAKTLNLSSNRYVRTFVKGSVRAAWRTTKFTARTSKTLVKGTTKLAVKAAKPVGMALVKTGRTVGTMATNLMHKPIKTLPGKFAKKVLKKPHAAGAKKVFQDAAKGAGKLVSAAKNGIQGLVSLLKSPSSITLIGGVLAFILLISSIVSIVSSISSSTGSLVLSPDASEEGKLDLSAYYDIVLDEWSKYTEELHKKGKDSGADKVIVNIDASPSNAKEILSMMAVRMSQDLDVDKNDDIEPYLRYLVRRLNPFTEEKNTYKCEGCVSLGPNKGSTCPGHTLIIYDIDTMFFGSMDETNDPVFSVDEMGNADQEAAEGGLIGTFEVTHYGPTGNLTATGTEPKAGRTIAVDPHVIPLGSHVFIDGHEYVAEDTGGAIKGNIIDIFVDSEEEAIEKGRRRNVKVYNVNYEGKDIQSSGKWNGWTDGNVKWCKLIYSMDWNEIYTGFDDYIGGVAPEGDIIVEGDFVWPVTTTSSSSGYGWRIHPVSGTRKFHKGTDIPVPTGTKVHAAADGTVTTAQYSSSAGNMIIIQHANGVMTKYFHNSKLYVKNGQKVKAGDVIALSGNTGISTGPHLHFEFWVNGSTVDPRKQYGF